MVNHRNSCTYLGVLSAYAGLRLTMTSVTWQPAPGYENLPPSALVGRRAHFSRTVGLDPTPIYTMRRLVPLLWLLLLAGCASREHTPQPSPINQRPIRPGDMVLQHPELRDGAAVCHRPILVIDSRKKHEDAITYLCR
jgi:hypothetical protein